MLPREPAIAGVRNGCAIEPGAATVTLPGTTIAQLPHQHRDRIQIAAEALDLRQQRFSLGTGKESPADATEEYEARPLLSQAKRLADCRLRNSQFARRNAERAGTHDRHEYFQLPRIHP